MTSCGPSRSKTRRASGSSPAVTSSPVSAQMLRTPNIDAPTMSAWLRQPVLVAAHDLHDGLDAACAMAMAMDTLEACAWAAGLSVALMAST